MGLQNRENTYTKTLAYVTYYDVKGKVRKETSWENWRDKKIDPIDHENVPTSGFVLNKKVGDYVSDWNHRQAYVRVYDPRGFEFEITIENLLYILENANSIKGKGLEGEFIYGWDGKDLVLLPVGSPDYEEISKFTSIIQNREYIKAKDLILGATYKTKDSEEWIYVGRYDYYGGKKKVKKYFFYKYSSYGYAYFHTLVSLGDKLINLISDDPVGNYAEIMTKLEGETIFSPYDKSKDEPVSFDWASFKNIIVDNRWGVKFYSGGLESSNIIKIEIRHNTQNLYQVKVSRDKDNGYNWGWDRESTIYEGTLENIFNKYKPMRKNKYLENGRLYQKDTI